eukprot:CAMPEP_0195516172 /NCGR_PEP_ID=MMETSP0794_2-20130614/6982_1 /TAXON_ID=515487 /ORGANISM="Stephanopyxis turris, Strain CCMP 815" /LENGTH=244 /DNA_ID=CAMNT_0040644699 /DNA_START=73 /DNA_END=803 /DNA_ORIENTATION=+
MRRADHAITINDKLGLSASSKSKSQKRTRASLLGIAGVRNPIMSRFDIASPFDGGDTLGYGGRDSRDASGKRYRVTVPKRMLLWVFLIFMVLPLLFLSYVLWNHFHPEMNAASHIEKKSQVSDAQKIKEQQMLEAQSWLEDDEVAQDEVEAAGVASIEETDPEEVAAKDISKIEVMKYTNETEAIKADSGTTEANSGTIKADPETFMPADNAKITPREKITVLEELKDAGEKIKDSRKEVKYAG